VFSFSTIRAHLERGASLSAVSIGLGGRLAKTKLEVALAGEGASAELLGLTYGDGKRHFDYVTLQDHIAPHTSTTSSSRRRSQAARARCGTAPCTSAKGRRSPRRTRPAATSSSATRRRRRRSRSSRSRRTTESRGIPRSESERLLIEAFYREVLDRIAMEPVREKVESLLLEKLETNR
jgi:Fe-S cluster assembly protein SufD